MSYDSNCSWPEVHMISTITVCKMLEVRGEGGGGGGGLHQLLPKFEHIFVAVINFVPFFCADTFDTSLLLIVCALR